MKDLAFVTINSDGSVIKKIPRSRMSVEGREKLVNEVIKALMTIPGSAFFHENYGSNFTTLTQYNYTDDLEMKSLMSTFIIQAEKSVLENQAGQVLSSEESLDQLLVMSTDVDNTSGKVVSNIGVVSLAGKSARISTRV